MMRLSYTRRRIQMTKSRKFIQDYAVEILENISPTIEEYIGVVGYVDGELKKDLIEKIEEVIINKEIRRMAEISYRALEEG
jgi:hypothetical protein